MVTLNNVVILILSTKDPEYDKFKSAIENTFLIDCQKKGLKCFFYEGGSDFNELLGNTIYLNTQDNLYGTSRKFFEALKFIYEKYPKTELIYRTNLSSYIDINIFIKFLKFHKFNNSTYAGVIGKSYYLHQIFYKNKILFYILSKFKFGKKIYYASGSGFFLGSNHCLKILSSNVNYNLIDDIMVAYTINFKPNPFSEPLRMSVDKMSFHYYDKLSYENLINQSMLFHYRFKTNNRDEDAYLLNQFGNENFRRTYLVAPDLS